MKKYFWKSLRKADEELGALELFKRTGKKILEKIITGRYSKREFDVNNCGGKILNLSWKNAKITKKGIEIVKTHLSRFESVTSNRKMLDRLEKIEAGEITVTDWDKRFYTHELRECERYKNLGVKDGIQTDYNAYNDLHTATLEDFKLIEIDDLGNENLYHPIVNPEDFHF